MIYSVVTSVTNWIKEFFFLVSWLDRIRSIIPENCSVYSIASEEPISSVVECLARDGGVAG